MSAGNCVPQLVSAAGGVNLLGEVGRHSPWLTWDELRRADPDVIVLIPCGFDLARTVAESALLTSHASWREFAAVRSGRVFAADGNALFNRPGPRLAESAEVLAEMFHPGRFRFGHEGRLWRRL